MCSFFSINNGASITISTFYFPTTINNVVYVYFTIYPMAGCPVCIVTNISYKHKYAHNKWMLWECGDLMLGMKWMENENGQLSPGSLKRFHSFRHIDNEILYMNDPPPLYMIHLTGCDDVRSKIIFFSWIYFFDYQRSLLSLKTTRFIQLSSEWHREYLFITFFRIWFLLCRGWLSVFDLVEDFCARAYEVFA